MTIHKALSKFAVSAAFALLLVGWSVLPVHADHLNFTLHNESSKSITYLYVSPASDPNWRQDVLGSGILRSGYYTRISFPGQTPNSPCMWDIKVVYADGTRTQKRFNLCQVDDVRAY